MDVHPIHPRESKTLARLQLGVTDLFSVYSPSAHPLPDWSGFFMGHLYWFGDRLLMSYKVCNGHVTKEETNVSQDFCILSTRRQNRLLFRTYLMCSTDFNETFLYCSIPKFKPLVGLVFRVDYKDIKLLLCNVLYKIHPRV